MHSTTLFAISVFLAVLAMPPAVFGNPMPSKALEGVSQYKNQEYDKAEKSFLEAIKEKPDKPELPYNLGNSHYKTGKFAEAIQAYLKAAEGNPDLQQKSAYNIGNSLFRLGKLQESAAAFKKALELNPDDMDAKFNLEFVREQLEKQKPKEKPKSLQPDSKKDKSQDKNDQDKNSGGDQERDHKQQDNGNPQEQPGSDKADKNKLPDDLDKNQLSPNKNQNPTPEEIKSAFARMEAGKMSKNEAEQWLSALQEDQKKFQRRQADKGSARPAYQGKDW